MTDEYELNLLRDFMLEQSSPEVLSEYLERLAHSAVQDRLGESEEQLTMLRTEIAILSQEKAALEEALHLLRMPAIEPLLVFLPAIFRNFWGVVRPDEVAMMAMTCQTITIPSPYPDPSPETVLFMKRRLQSMPQDERDAILNFCRNLPHRLQIRVEMRGFFS